MIINFGPEIPRDHPTMGWTDSKPNWLRDDTPCAIKKYGKWLGSYYFRSAAGWVWSKYITAIRLPADDPASLCRKYELAHPGCPPLTPWYGGEDAPADWDGGNKISRGLGMGNWVFWRHPWHGRRGTLTEFDIVGYVAKRAAVPEPSLPTYNPATHALVPIMSEKEMEALWNVWLAVSKAGNRKGSRSINWLAKRFGFLRADPPHPLTEKLGREPTEDERRVWNLAIAEKGAGE